MLAAPSARAGLLDIAQVPLFMGGTTTPLVMMVMGRDHKLYYEAYNDASDLNGDGILDTTYKPTEIDYFGLFDSYLCYSYGSSKFTPVSKTVTKKCSGNWSGDFLNYLTTSRMDALRKVLYGGYRIPTNDTASGTVLERAYIPQDAHSWGKEYLSTAYNGYDITQYTPLAQPKIAGARHLFANTTLLNTTTPLLRVLDNSVFRVWEWLSIERPVAGDQCSWGAKSGGAEDRVDCIYTGSYYEGTPAEVNQFNSLFLRYVNSLYSLGSGPTTQINGSSNPFGASDHYLMVFTGTLKINTAGSYQFYFTGDDTAQLWIDGVLIGGRYNSTSTASKVSLGSAVSLKAGNHTLEFRYQEKDGTGSYQLLWKGPDSGNSQVVMPASAFSDLTRSSYRTLRPKSERNDYTVRVDACVSGLRTENDPSASEYCAGYPIETPTVYKPAGLLQQYGQDEPERMAFGLITGSYMKNTDGGVLRKNIGPFSKTSDAGNEIDRTTGIFNTSVNGIVQTLNKLTVTGFGSSYQYSCGWIVDRFINPGECRMWGNPIGEMMYESLRYFAGKPTTGSPAATPDFLYSESNDDGLTLPKPAWKYPFRKEAGGYAGAKCFMLPISDINPSFDTDKVPGTAFGSYSGDLIGFNAADLASTIWANEEQSNPAFIGHSLDNNPAYDGAPTPKTVTSLGRIRGLSPEEPTKQGGFYSAAAAYFGNVKGISGDPAKAGKQRVETLSVALASPLPRFEIPVGTGRIALVPFAKSVGGSVGSATINPAQGQFQPTNQIVDFYVERIANTGAGNADPNDNGGRPHGIFRINYEDVEQGADHDMDAIIRYEFWVLADNTFKVRLDSSYAAGSIEHHLGYVISGTDGQDGVYLDVRDQDTTEANDDDYFLDTPLQTTTDASSMTTKRSTWTTDVWKHKASYGALPLTATRLFRPATSATAARFIKHDPLWYAAKWGGFADANADGLPEGLEWDSDNDGVPDNYFLVTNAGKLKEQLSKAFQAILSKRASAAIVPAFTSGEAWGKGYLYLARFNSTNWTGQVLAIKSPYRFPNDLVWDAGEELDKRTWTDRTIFTYNPATKKAVPFLWGSLSPSQQQILSPKKADGTYDLTIGQERLQFLRGDNSNEGDAAGQFRRRDTDKVDSNGPLGSDLGDIINSNPVYLAYPTNDYGDSLETPTYTSFRVAKADRPGMIYVGANDGMLHGFRANDGFETMAYVPTVVYPELGRLTWQSYNTTTGGGSSGKPQTSQHRYYVDNTPSVDDAFFDGAWHTVLIGRLGAGGQGTFALDVTDPTTFSATNFLWEFTDASDADLGYTFGQADIAKTNAGTWTAIFGNGYNSAQADGYIGSGQGVLYLVNVKTGDLIKKLAAGTSSSGLSTPWLYDVDGDDKVDWVYAGDVLGNLWKFDVRSNIPGNWQARLLFAAGSAQPITSSPQTVKHPRGGVLVLFGTGRYLGNTDIIDTSQQTYYAIWDREDSGPDGKWDTADDVPFSTVTMGPGNLLEQNFQGYVVMGGKTWRTSSAKEICWYDEKNLTNTDQYCQFTCTEETLTDTTGCDTAVGRKNKGENYAIPPKFLGWYINLPYQGERVYSDSTVSEGRILFTSNAPASADDTPPDPCEVKVNTGKYWVNVLDALTGKRLGQSYVKVDEEGKVTPVQVIDPLTGQPVAPSSIEGEGISAGQRLISRPKPDDPLVLCSGPECADPLSIASSRLSWRQLPLPTAPK